MLKTFHKLLQARAIIMLMERFFRLGAGAVATFMVARMLGAEALGTYGVVMVWAAFLAPLSGMGLNNLVQKMASTQTSPEQARVYLQTALWLRLAAGLLFYSQVHALSVVDAKLEDNVLRVGTDATFPPMEYVDNGKRTGFDIELVEALATSMTFDMKGVDAYGLFDEQFRPLSGPIRAIPPDLPLDGKIHALANCVDSDDPKLPKDSCDAVATHTDDGRWLVHLALYRSDSDLGSRLAFDTATQTYAVVRERVGAMRGHDIGHADQAAVAHQVVGRIIGQPARSRKE